MQQLVRELRLIRLKSELINFEGSILGRPLYQSMRRSVPFERENTYMSTWLVVYLPALRATHNMSYRIELFYVSYARFIV